MTWNAETTKKIDQAFDDCDVAEFKRLLVSHPEYLRDEDGADRWMWLAAAENKLPIMQALLELGLDVNESRDSGDESDPFYQPEGSIVQAATKGHIEIVRWLLDRGAKINYVVENQSRCLPLIRAATEGHLDVIKLLIEHGADFRSTWDGLSALKQAEKFGRKEARDYLQSLEQGDT